mmetsp:Transcript_3053/g.9326  ORF Transcript_3053/g.9326 Transcript_3053/m.9326 type:complete len:448 (-) Transcript_3053:85-1428(-)|eukprot:CAMPEP_0198736256 /NCGR_PEP_ID=MMETSP1475-20131203/64520_1 /TAXON_ID= ORGANISM="Unidentified sp., Strain CCMP1999" /NCGR_SAMPLE_ID=MMETSP1475 /ASSEMBLY_ACC=CAM_ASM_001111 /LENGTH=447 /DNA_ID=CAMNT_0044500029 /DNA_START=81 /DNA_END=1424 /DNA_ORIENTATION=+
MKPKVLIGLGSNVGDRLGNINYGLCNLRSIGTLVQTSFLYWSKPMYVTDQPHFYNAVCELETEVPPLDLLSRVKQIEAGAGRHFAGRRYGPRSLDLDLLLYGSEDVRLGEKLTIPHPRIHERDFVLRPLADICRHVCIRGKSIQSMLDELERRRPEEVCQRVMAVRNRELEFVWGRKSICMGILNITPDSFSDGGDNVCLEGALKSAEAFIASGCDILDVGGQSTRPGAEEITAQEERNRVLPVIRALREKYPTKTAISVDTFHASVADAAIDAGADIVNDVSGGERDVNMLQTIQRRGVPCILMHMRGDSKTMTRLATYEDLVSEVAAEMRARTAAAQSCGIPRWNIIVDPGFGFAKNGGQNLQLVGKLQEIKDSCGGFPMLTGLSRKRFIGDILGNVAPKDRDFGSAAAAVLCRANGSDIFRFHNPRVADALKVADSILNCGQAG